VSFQPLQLTFVGRVAQSVYRLATGWTVRRSKSGGGGARFSAPVQTGPGAHPPSCTMGTGSFPGIKSGGGVTLTPHALLVSWSRKSRAISLLPLWAARPVHSVEQKSIGVIFRTSRSGSDVRYSCHHNSSRFSFPTFAHSWRFSVFHSLQSITPRIY